MALQTVFFDWKDLPPKLYGAILAALPRPVQVSVREECDKVRSSSPNYSAPPPDPACEVTVVLRIPKSELA
jgi:hypothetical protein